MFCCNCADSSQVAVAEVRVATIPVNTELNIFPSTSSTTPVNKNAVPTGEEELITATAEPAPSPHATSGSVRGGGKTFKVLVLGARNLRNADLLPGTGKSDSFVVVEAAGKSFQTPVVKDSLQPVWNFEGELVDVPDGADISFAVWDQDPVGKDLLGRAKLAAKDFEAKGFSGELVLEEGAAPMESFLRVKVKTLDQQYLTGSGSRFNITLEKPASATLGLEVDPLDGFKLQITDIKPGIFDTWNATAPPELKVLVGDYIVDVNGIVEAPAAMMARLKADSTLKLAVRRAQEFPIQIVKKDGQLGVDLNFAANGNSILVLKVGEEGPVSEWNEANKDLAVQKLDRITAVNGVKGSSKELFDVVKANEKLHLLISRPAEDGWWAHQ